MKRNSTDNSWSLLTARLLGAGAIQAYKPYAGAYVQMAQMNAATGSASQDWVQEGMHLLRKGSQ